MLQRKNIKVGDLLVGIDNGRYTVTVGTVYIVLERIGYGKNGIFVMEVKSGKKFHSHTRWFKKTDIF